MTAIPHPNALDLQHEPAHGVTADAHAAHAGHQEMSFFKKYIFSTDHKIIGIQFLFIGLMFMVIGGLEAMLVRWQLGWPGRAVPLLSQYMVNTGAWNAGAGGKLPGMPPEFYNAAFTMHASLMIFFVIIPLLVGTFGNYLIPLKIGAPDMAFPFLNGFTFWLAVPAGAIMTAGFFLTAPIAGWTSYPPLSAIVLNQGMVPFLAPTNGFETFLSYLQIHGVAPDGSPLMSAWTPIPLLLNTLALFMCFLYIASYAVRFKKRRHVLAWSGVLIALGLIYTLLLVGFFQHPRAFSDWGLGHPLEWKCFGIAAGAYLVVNGLLGLISRRWASIFTSLLVCAALAYFAVHGLQYAVFDGQSAWFVAIFLVGFASILGAVNYMTTIVKLRCPGMTMFRMPLSIWSLFITSILVLLATPVLASVLLMNLLEHHRLTNFFLPVSWIDNNKVADIAGGGYPLLHQHLFWFYSHPAVYIMILPAMGMVSDIIAVFSRKPIFGYRPMVYALSGIAFLGFIVWAHHMFQSGMNPTLGTTFAISTMFIAVPSAIKVFNWLGTVWGGNIRFTAAMLCALAFVAQFVVGGLSGIFMASTAVDVHIHDTYFIVAHIHYVLFGSSLFGIFAAIYFWYPKMFGRMMSERLGVIHFWLTFIFFNLCFFPMHILGLSGFPRRVAEYSSYQIYSVYQPMNQFISYMAFALGVSQILFVINFIGSWFFGKKAGRNPWLCSTLEWETPSPPPHGNFEKTPIVHHGPYEYATPLVEEDWLAQTRWVEGAHELASAKH